MLFRSSWRIIKYLIFTRPDLASLVNKICHYLHAPIVAHWILRYIKGSVDLGLTFRKSPSSLVNCFFYANWAGCSDDKQATMSRSNSEVRYEALAMLQQR